MGTSVCAACVELWEGGTPCPRCGGRPAEGREGLLAWERARHRERVTRWAAGNVIDAKTAQALLERLDGEGAPAEGGPGEASGEVAKGDVGAAAGVLADTAFERGADALLSGTAAFAREVSARWARLARAVEEGKAAPRDASGGEALGGGAGEGDSPPSDDGDEGRAERPGAEAGRAIFARGAQGAVVGAGVEALATLDDEGDARGPSRPLGALEAFWFIGTLLVLAGSVMGVREAWRSLEGVFRPLVISAAFFVYHALFAGLARLLSRRSATTGGVLTVIASGLLPVVFAAAAVAVGQRPALGVPFAGALFVASALTLSFVGRVAAGPGAGFALSFGLCPALALELFIGAGGASPGRRVLVALVALAPVALAATRLRRRAGGGAPVALAASAYGAIAVGVLALYGGPGDAALDPDDDLLTTRSIVGWFALASTIRVVGDVGQALRRALFEGRGPFARSRLGGARRRGLRGALRPQGPDRPARARCARAARGARARDRGARL